MEKPVLKTVIQTLTPGDRVTVAFRGTRVSESGEFEVVTTKRGRGKGGSQLVELKTSAGELVTTGTPESEVVLHIITPDGTLHGFESEADVPPTFETDPLRAAELKEKFSTLVDAEGQYTVAVRSTHEAFNGTFTVARATQLRGRYGQVVLTLARPTGETFDVWSFRHSGVITGFDVTSTS
jgi:hypothetical protein